MLKGSFLLGLSVPFAFYASEGLCLWARVSRARATAIGVWMGVLFLAVAAVFTQGVVFEKRDPPGFQWEMEPRGVPGPPVAER